MTGRTNRKLINWNRNNRIKLRNFTEPNDIHDVVKLLYVRLLRRKHKNNVQIPIYTEYDSEKPNEAYPDIQFRINGDIYVIEIQRKITESWLKEINKKWEDVNLIIIPLEKFDEQDTVKIIKEKLKDYLI